MPKTYEQLQQRVRGLEESLRALIRDCESGRRVADMAVALDVYDGVILRCKMALEDDSEHSDS